MDQQVYSIWKYLEDGDKASAPQGVGQNLIELYVFDEAVMYRNFIQGAGPRAIGVGYPERANLAFDANQMGIALLWHGSFMDAGRHWTGRGQGFQPPLGDNVLSLGQSPTIAVLESRDATWPSGEMKKQGYQFLAAGLACGLSSLASGLAIGVAGDAGVRAYAQTDGIFVGMILILIFAECIGLYGMIVAIIMMQ